MTDYFLKDDEPVVIVADALQLPGMRATSRMDTIVLWKGETLYQNHKVSIEDSKYRAGFTPCRTLISLDLGQPFHSKSDRCFTDVGHRLS